MSKKCVERLALGVMGVGVVMVSQPWVFFAFRWGFLVTLAGIVLMNVAGRMGEMNHEDTKGRRGTKTDERGVGCGE